MKKSVIIIAVIVVILLIGLILFLTLGSKKAKNKDDIDKLIKYIETKGYSCKDKVCTRTNDDKEEKLTFENNKKNYKVTYSIKTDKISTSFSNLNYIEKGNNDIYIEDFVNETNCLYDPADHRTRDGVVKDWDEYGVWEINDKSAIDKKICGIDYSKELDEYLREFESYFKEANVKLVN